MKTMTFSDIHVGAQFYCNGNECIKRSTRTAELLAYGRVFYFSHNDKVTL